MDEKLLHALTENPDKYRKSKKSKKQNENNSSSDEKEPLIVKNTDKPVEKLPENEKVTPVKKPIENDKPPVNEKNPDNNDEVEQLNDYINSEIQRGIQLALIEMKKSKQKHSRKTKSYPSSSESDNSSSDDSDDEYAKKKRSKHRKYKKHSSKKSHEDSTVMKCLKGIAIMAVPALGQVMIRKLTEPQVKLPTQSQQPS